MADDRLEMERKIRARAYRIWEEEGCPPGRAEAHWDMASELVAQEENQELRMEPNPAGSGRDRADRDQPVEPLEAVENAGEFPTLTDQGDKKSYPPRRATRRRGASRRQRSE